MAAALENLASPSLGHRLAACPQDRLRAPMTTRAIPGASRAASRRATRSARASWTSIYRWLNLRFRGTWTPTPTTTVNISYLYGKEHQGADSAAARSGRRPGPHFARVPELARARSDRQLKLSSRTRLEQRFFRGGIDTGWRLRESIKLTRPLDSTDTWSLVLSDELFVNDASLTPNVRATAGLDRNRFFIGPG